MQFRKFGSQTKIYQGYYEGKYMCDLDEASWESRRKEQETEDYNWYYKNLETFEDECPAEW